MAVPARSPTRPPIEYTVVGRPGGGAGWHRFSKAPMKRPAGRVRPHGPAPRRRHRPGSRRECRHCRSRRPECRPAPHRRPGRWCHRCGGNNSDCHGHDRCGPDGSGGVRCSDPDDRRSTAPSCGRGGRPASDSRHARHGDHRAGRHADRRDDRAARYTRGHARARAPASSAPTQWWSSVQCSARRATAPIARKGSYAWSFSRRIGSPIGSEAKWFRTRADWDDISDS